MNGNYKYPIRIPGVKINNLSIIIVTYNSLAYISACIDSIYDNSPEDGYEMILVDNASTDGTANHIRKNYPDVQLIINKKNRGFAAAANQGIDASGDSDYILLINADCEVFEHSIDRLVKYLEDNPKAAIAGPRILNSDGTIQYSCRTFPSFRDAAVHTLLAHIYPHNRATRKYMLMDANRDKPFKVDWVSGSVMMIRRKALEETGAFDENYFMYVEDIDLCYRMWQKGWEVHYMPYSEVLHHVAGSSRKKKSLHKKSRRAQVRASFRMQRSVFYFFRKNYRGTSRMLLLPFIIAALGIRFFIAAIKTIIRP